MRHPPDAVLVGHQEFVAPPGQTIGPVEVLDMAVDPFGATLAVIAQQGQVAGALLGDQDIAIGQHEQAARIDQPGGDQSRGKSLRDAQCLLAKRNRQRAIRGDRPGLRRREIGGIDAETVADFVLDREILRHRVGLGLRPAGWQRQHDRRPRGKPDQQGPEFFGHGSSAVLEQAIGTHYNPAEPDLSDAAPHRDYQAAKMDYGWRALC
jgi:hypothetical protein